MANSELARLIREWGSAGRPLQQASTWANSRSRWISAFPAYSKFLSGLPGELGREDLHEIMASETSTVNKFLAVMIWGYGDIGYGPYRVNQMLTTDGYHETQINSFLLSNKGEFLVAYQYLATNRIDQLGPSFGTKWISFCSSRENPAPIYDSYIALWVSRYAAKDFKGVSTNSENWNLKTYRTYCNWMKELENIYALPADMLEFIIFEEAFREYS